MVATAADDDACTAWLGPGALPLPRIPVTLRPPSCLAPAPPALSRWEPPERTSAPLASLALLLPALMPPFRPGLGIPDFCLGLSPSSEERMRTADALAEL